MLSTKDEIGKMDRRITFQEAIYGTDESNQHKLTGWQDIESYPTTSAEVLEPSGNEVYQGDQLVGVTAASFRTRYRTDITVQNRILYNNKIYNIHAILEIGRKRFLKFTCESGGQYQETET